MVLKKDEKGNVTWEPVTAQDLDFPVDYNLTARLATLEQEGRVSLNPNHNPPESRYDPQADLRGVEVQLRAIDINKSTLTPRSEDERRQLNNFLNTRYNAALAFIADQEKAFRERLEAAKQTGTIDDKTYLHAQSDLDSLSSPFRQARDKAAEAYHKHRKF